MALSTEGMESIVLCYAADDAAAANYLADYVEANLPFAVSRGEAVVGPDLGLMEAMDRALSAEAALVLLSPHSVPAVWERRVWEPLFLVKPKEFQTFLGFVLLTPCKFPALLRKERFFDAAEGLPETAREIKRWLLRPHQGVVPAAKTAEDLEALRSALGDRPGAAEAGVEAAVRFAGELGEDFEAVHVFDCRGRSRAGMLGDIGSALGLTVSGALEQNRAVVCEWCAGHRVLFVLAGVAERDRAFATFGGRASVIFTGPPEGELQGCRPNATADAVRKFQQNAAVDCEAGLRLGWTAVRLLKAQERVAETLELLEEMAAVARRSGDHNALPRIQKEQFWMGGGAGPESSALLVEGEQMRLAFGSAL